MLAYLLAILVGLGSAGLYWAAFSVPEIHRRHDFIWSGVGCFYALVLWVCAPRITGGLLLGQIASVALVGWFGYQTLKLRREQIPVTQRTPLPESAAALLEILQKTLPPLRAKIQSIDRAWLNRQFEQATQEWEVIWQTLSRRINALISTTFAHPADSVPVAPPVNPDPAAEWSDPSPEANSKMNAVKSATIHPPKTRHLVEPANTAGESNSLPPLDLETPHPPKKNGVAEFRE